MFNSLKWYKFIHIFDKHFANLFINKKLMHPLICVNIVLLAISWIELWHIMAQWLTTHPFDVISVNIVLLAISWIELWHIMAQWLTTHPCDVIDPTNKILLTFQIYWLDISNTKKYLSSPELNYINTIDHSRSCSLFNRNIMKRVLKQYQSRRMLQTQSRKSC